MRLLLIVSLLGLGLGGCSRSGLQRASIAGAVRIDGEPVERGTIRLISIEPNGGPTVGGDIVDGRYRISGQRGPSLGKHRVEVNVPHKTGRKTRSPFAMPPVDGEAWDSAGTVDEWVERAPKQYNSESILEVIISAGMNEFDISMNTK
jgi:hypothetical protein